MGLCSCYHLRFVIENTLHYVNVCAYVHVLGKKNNGGMITAVYVYIVDKPSLIVTQEFI